MLLRIGAVAVANEQGKSMSDSKDPADADFALGPQSYVFSDDDDETGLAPAHPASTLVIFHEPDPAHPPQLLMVRRSQKMTFAAGAAVFPGGRVDADDHDLAAALALPGIDRADAAARIAAIRETLEETGLAVGIVHGGGPDALDRIRTGLLAEQPFSALLRDHDAALDLSGLVPFARWRPNFNHARVFDARFYLTRLEGSIPDLSVHAHENSEFFWSSAAQTLDRADSGDLDIIFPTRRNLERLAQYHSFDAAAESANRFPPRRITPWVEIREGQRHLCIREDCGYPVVSEALSGAMRG
jgi:8-oxo-dGTP pyrophosphatase MutT (NUDIX family)